MICSKRGSPRSGFQQGMSPGGNGENRQHLCEALSESPSGDDVRYRNLVDVAAL
jgi:hypothetical protein